MMKNLILWSCVLLAGTVGCGGGDDSALRNEKEQLEAQLRILAQEKDQKQYEHDRLQIERSSLIDESARLRSELNANSSAYDNEKKSWADARQTLVTENETLNAQLREKETLKEEQKRWTAANDELSNELLRLKKVLNEENQKHRQEAERHQQQAGEATKDKLELNEKLAQLKKDVENLETLNRQLKTDSDQLRDDLAFAQNGSSDSAKLSKEISELRTENKDLEAKNKGMIASLADLDRQLVALRDLEKQNAQTLADKTTIIAKLETDKQSLETNNEIIRQQLDAEKIKLQNSVKALQGSNQDLSNKVREVQDLLTVETKKNKDVGVTVADLRAQLKTAEDLKTTQESEHQTLLDGKIASIKDLTAQVDDLRLVEKNLLQEKTSLESLLAQSRQTVISLESMTAQQKSEMEQTTLAKQSLETENASLRAELESEKEKIEAEIETLSKKNAALTKNIVQLQENILSQKQERDAAYAKLEQGHQALNLELTQVKQLKEDAQTENTRLSKLNNEIDDKLKKLQDERELEQKANKLYKTTSISKIDVLTASVTALESEKQRLENEVSAREGVIEQLKVEARRQEDEKRKQIAAFEKINDANQNFEEDAKTLRSDLEAERNALKVKNAELISIKKEFNTRLVEFTQNLDASNQRGLQKDDAIIELEGRLADEKRKGLEAIRAAEEKERLRVRSDTSTESSEELYKEIQDLKTSNHKLKMDNDDVKAMLDKVQKEMLARDEPREMFKRESQEFLTRLRQMPMFDRYSNDQIETFKDDVRYLTRSDRLLDMPEQDQKRFSLPLPLVFDQAPKPPVEFTVYIASAVDNWDALEETAQFILATDDEKLIQELLTRNQKGEFDYRSFKVQVDFPILCLGSNVFMLPKALLNPLYENEMAKLIEFNYDFDEGLSEPLEYQLYVEKRKMRDERIATSKNQAMKGDGR